VSDEYESHTDYEIEPGTFPAELLSLDRWFVWALDDGRKIPRAPWANSDHIDRYVSWKDRENWVDFETADEWVEKVDRFGHASCIPAFEDNTQERLLFFDFDDCRDPETGEIHGQAWGFIEKYGLSAYLSTSGTGVHAFGWGSLPEGYKPSFEIALPSWDYDDKPHLEVYASARFMALTGEHIAGTPVGVPDLDDLAHELFESKGTERTTGTEREPDVSRDELQNVDTTTDLDDIYDAIAHVRPRDIRLRSPVTEEYSGRDANCARDPSWANSKSGTRLAEFDDHWLYRKGNHNLDALQVVALEERILRDESDYPSGDDFVEAVDALRERGAHIPELQTERTTSFDVTSDDDADAESATDGGTAAADASDDAPGRSRYERFESDVRAAISAVEENDDLTERTARHRIAQAFTTHYDFVYPEEEVRGWRTTLYVYDGDAGVYEPRGDYFVKNRLETAAGDYTTNQVTNEIVEKIKRMTTERGPAFERDPHRLAVANGILNLHTGELDPFSPAEYHRQKLDVAWNPDAGEPAAVDEFLHDIVEPSDVGTLYRLIAHTIYKEYIGEKAAILIGSGQNGKSVFLDMIEQFLGTYNVAHRELQDFDTDLYAANNLEGKLANLATEIGEQQLDDTTTFKKLTGRDTMDAPVKFEKPIEFENYATLMFATNEMPVFGQDNHAIWRRWVYVDFPYTFDATDPEAKDPEPKDVLMRRLTDDAEQEALLLRCQQEIQRWHEDAHAEFFADAMAPEQVRDKMKKAAEPVYNFASTCLDVGDQEDTFVEKSVVRAAYRAYADEEDLPTLPENTFGEQLVSLRDFPIDPGQRRVDGSPTRVYNGVELSSRGRQVLGVDETDDSAQQQVDDGPQATAIVLDELRDMVDENDGEPVPREGVEWRCSGQIGKATASNAIDDLKKNGRVFDGDDGLLPTE
jgi:P4 family phage/plasmid primase-like protien